MAPGSGAITINRGYTSSEGGVPLFLLYAKSISILMLADYNKKDSYICSVLLGYCIVGTHTGCVPLNSESKFTSWAVA